MSHRNGAKRRAGRAARRMRAARQGSARTTAEGRGRAP
jgi:hypothetical protein